MATLKLIESFLSPFYLWLTDRPYLSQLQLLSRLSRALKPRIYRFPRRPLDVIDNTSSPSYSTKVTPHPRKPYAVSYSLHLHLILQFITRRGRHNSSDYEHLNQEGYHKGSAKQFFLASQKSPRNQAPLQTGIYKLTFHFHRAPNPSLQNTMHKGEKKVQQHNRYSPRGVGKENRRRNQHCIPSCFCVSPQEASS